MSNEKIPYNMTDEALEQFATKLFEKVNARINSSHCNKSFNVS